MDATTALSSLTDQPVLDPVAEPLSKGHHRVDRLIRDVRTIAPNRSPPRPIEVACPWHVSEFALADGRVINGPATHDQPCLDVRERNGRIEVKQRG